MQLLIGIVVKVCMNDKTRNDNSKNEEEVKNWLSKYLDIK